MAERLLIVLVATAREKAYLARGTPQVPEGFDRVRYVTVDETERLQGLRIAGYRVTLNAWSHPQVYRAEDMLRTSMVLNG